MSRFQAKGFRLYFGTMITAVEDAMQVAAADAFGAQVIATRNVKDYRKSPIKAMTPEALVKVL